jgi:hypothetical protein
MSIATYTDLKAKIAEYLARDDLTSATPDFIKLAEAKFNRELFVRQMEARATTTADINSAEPEFITLPSDFQSMRRVRVSSVDGKPQMEFMSSVQLDEYRTKIGNATGQPRYFTIFGTEMELAPTPDSAATIEMVYRANIPALSDSNVDNWLLLQAPDAYIYGSLLESAPYMKEDARIQVWGAGLTTTLDSLNRLGLTSTFNAGPLTVRTSGRVF